MKTHPGSVVHLSDNPLDSNKVSFRVRSYVEPHNTIVDVKAITNNNHHLVLFSLFIEKGVDRI